MTAAKGGAAGLGGPRGAGGKSKANRATVAPKAPAGVCEELNDAAQRYARLGWGVFPCRGEAKRPAGMHVPNGLHDATTDAGTIAAWWPKRSRLNIGIVPPEGCFVVDLDCLADDNYLGRLTTTILAG